MLKPCLYLYFIFFPIFSAYSLTKGSVSFRFHKNKILERKSFDDAYARFRKTYDPYKANSSNLNRDEADQIEKLFHLADMAVIEKVLLLEFIGKIHDGEVSRNAYYKSYYQKIIDQMSILKVSKRVNYIKINMIKGIEFHRKVLDSWLKAARDNQVHKVQNKLGRWVHPGTSLGDKIFYNLYHEYIQKNFKEENKENLEALKRHLCVLVF